MAVTMQKIDYHKLPDRTTPITDSGTSGLNTLQTNIENALNNIINVIYPIGSIYMSVNSTSPATLFGGTWERIQDRFLLSAGSTYSAGATGGSASHKITSAELPKHTHTYNKPNANTNSHTLTINEIPSHNHNVYINGQGSGGRKELYMAWGYSSNDDVKNYSGNSFIANTGGGQGHTHGIGTTSTASGDGGFANNSFSTLPPYLAVYVWKRTA